MLLRSIFLCAAATLAAAVVHAHDYKLNDLRIDHPYARTTAPHQPSGAAYLSIENGGKSADKLVAVASPVAKSVEIHTMSMEGDVMRMREVSGIELAPAAKVEMKPGHGYHLMLLGLRQPLKAGDKFPLTLTFEKAGKTEVMVFVEDSGKKGAAESSAPKHQH